MQKWPQITPASSSLLKDESFTKRRVTGAIGKVGTARTERRTPFGFDDGNDNNDEYNT